ncbi:hypothetical protein HDU97_002900 [Phlyctochytrium planicorne]|nr:hypothetical protein HDU97_002900 [Phlyctochytrium planicorne]
MSIDFLVSESADDRQQHQPPRHHQKSDYQQQQQRPEHREINSSSNSKKRNRTVFSLITPHDYKTGTHCGHNAGAHYVSVMADNHHLHQQPLSPSPTPSPVGALFPSPPPSPATQESTEPPGKKVRVAAPPSIPSVTITPPPPPPSSSNSAPPSSSSDSPAPGTVAPPGFTLKGSPADGFICPLAHCTASFLRRYNMVQHFRAHAARIGISAIATERGCKALKGVPEGCVPEFFAKGGH